MTHLCICTVYKCSKRSPSCQSAIGPGQYDSYDMIRAITGMVDK